MDHSLLEIGGLEILNSHRTAVYANAGFKPATTSISECGCQSIGDLFGETYTTPYQDGAPWVSPADPASYDFAGFYPMGITGAEDGAMTREVIQTIRGARFAPIRCGPRTITFDGLLIGATCCATSYGLRWLRNALLPDACDDCSGDTASFIDCCPDCSREEGQTATTCDHIGGGDIAPQSDDPCDCHDSVVRCMRDVSLVSGPTVTERIGTGCGRCGGDSCPILRVEFTLVSTRPWIYGRRFDHVADLALPTDDPECAPDRQWSKDGDDCRTIIDDCEDLPCGTLENPCGDLIPPPPIALSSLKNCVCTDDPVGAQSTFFRIEQTETTRAGEHIPTIIVNSGSEELRNLTIRLIPDVRGTGCEALFNDDGSLAADCDVCQTIHVSHLPSGSSLEIDGVDEQLRVLCPGGVIDPADRIVHGEGGAPFRHVPLPCGVPVCVVVTTDPRFTADDANMTFRTTERWV